MYSWDINNTRLEEMGYSLEDIEWGNEDRLLKTIHIRKGNIVARAILGFTASTCASLEMKI